MRKNRILFLLLVGMVMLFLAACQGNNGAAGLPGIPGTGITLTVDCMVTGETRVSQIKTSREIEFLIDEDGNLGILVALPNECGGGTLKGTLPLSNLRVEKVIKK